MALADFEPHRVKVTFKGGELMVRGLGLEDIAALFRDHLDDIEAIVGILSQDVTKDTALMMLTQHGIAIVREAPALAANLICRASDEPDAVDKARMLPLYVQVEALEKIVRLTFEEAGGPKKFAASLRTLLTGWTPTPQVTDSPT